MKNQRKQKSTWIFKRKKANVVLEGGIFILFLIVLAYAVYIVNQVGDDIRTDIINDDTMTTKSKQIINQKMDNYPTFWDDLFIVGLVFVWIMIIVASFLIDSHPIFFAISIILLIFMLVVAMYLGNSYEDFVSDDLFNGYVASYPKIHFIMTHLVEILVAIGITVLMTVYGKSRWSD